MILAKKGKNLEDNIQIFIMVPCAGYALLALTNCYKIVSHREIFENLVNDLRDMYPRGEVTEEQHQIISKANSIVSYVVRGYYYSNALLLIAYMSRPYIATLKRHLGYDAPKEMLLLYYFPFDALQPVVFEVITVVQTWQGTVAVLSLQCGVMMFCILLSHIAVQFDLLSLRVQGLVQVSTDDQLPPTYPLNKYGSISKNCVKSVTDDGDSETRIREELDNIISRHRTLIRLAGDVEDLMSLPLLLIFANSIIIICFCGFCAVIVEKISDVVYKTFLVTALLQIWLVCSYGQRLVESSEGFSEALYKCGWYKTSIRNRKTIFIMMHRSQKAVRVTTYGFQTVLCLASYTTVIKTSWSYLSLLLNVYKEK
ncbi:odorant receptor 4-like [Plodia interpunctella]|uniref:odorant receptor 4-like n=1 Tax=Plodia interpunctella TaxID=58824 RepID=UPI0023683123|nr:odorant receptor 4-like [Plodia interpunctella]